MYGPADVGVPLMVAAEGFRIRPRRRPAGRVPAMDQLKEAVPPLAVQVAEYGAPTLTGPVVGVQLNVRITGGGKIFPLYGWLALCRERLSATLTE